MSNALEVRAVAVHLSGMDPEMHPPVRREPVFKIPFVPLVVGLGLIALYAVQGQLAYGGLVLGLRPADLADGYYTGLLTHMIAHGGWMHVLMNAFAVVAFGAPVMRDFDRAAGPIGWLVFFIICGVLAGAGYSALHAGDPTPVVGASGAAFGLIGASLRLMAGPGFLIPITHPSVLRGAAAWMGVNLLTGLLGSTIAGDGAAIAWEAHAAGFIAGLILIGPFHAILSRKQHPLLSR